MTSIKKLATAALLALGLLAMFAGPASAMNYSLNIAHPEGGSIGSLPGAAGLATDSAGNVYVAERQGSKVEKFSSSGKYLGKFVGLSEAPVDVDVDPSGNVWVSSPNRLTKFSPSGTVLKANSFSWVGASANATDLSGNLYEVGPSSAVKLDSNANLMTLGALGGGSGWHPTDVDVDTSGRIYLGEPGSVKLFNSTGTYVSTVTYPTTKFAAGVAGDNSGNIWFAEPGFCHIRKISSTGTLLDTFGECGTGAGKLQYEKMPHERPGIAVGPGGVVWVSNGTEVQKWVP